MNSLKIFAALFVVFGLMLAKTSLADQVVISEHAIHWGHHNSLVRVSYRHSAQHNTDSVVIVDRLVTYWVESPFNHGRIRVTVPMRYYLTSWDVKALERELERLGVKGKPKPVPPKPVSVYSG